MKIKVVGIYVGVNERGTVVGGVPFLTGVESSALVDEDTYKNLLVAEQNAWFKIVSSDYDKLLEHKKKLSNDFNAISKKDDREKDSTVKVVQKIVVSPKKEEAEDIKASLEEKKEEVVQKKKPTKKAKKSETTEE